MLIKLKRSEPEIIGRKGKPAAVIVPLDDNRTQVVYSFGMGGKHAIMHWL